MQHHEVLAQLRHPRCAQGLSRAGMAGGGGVVSTAPSAAGAAASPGISASR